MEIEQQQYLQCRNRRRHQYLGTSVGNNQAVATHAGVDASASMTGGARQITGIVSFAYSDSNPPTGLASGIGVTGREHPTIRSRRP